MDSLSFKQFAICINNAEYPASLDMYKVYRVLPDKKAEKHGDIRVVDESGEGYLFPADYFVLIQPPLAIARLLNKAYAHAR
jgi:hypothetical protein